MLLEVGSHLLLGGSSQLVSGYTITMVSCYPLRTELFPFQMAIHGIELALMLKEDLNYSPCCCRLFGPFLVVDWHIHK